MSERICPTCETVFTEDRQLAYLAANNAYAPEVDNVSRFQEEAERLVQWLSALAQAGPLAVTQYDAESDGNAPDWLEDYVKLAEELSAEAQRRLDLMGKAGGLLEKRVKDRDKKTER